MLDPARLRIMLRDLAIAVAPNLAVGPDDDRGGAGGPLVETQDDGCDVAAFQVRFRLPVE
jgi:hypothetical protein